MSPFGEIMMCQKTMIRNSKQMSPNPDFEIMMRGLGIMGVQKNIQSRDLVIIMKGLKKGLMIRLEHPGIMMKILKDGRKHIELKSLNQGNQKKIMTNQFQENHIMNLINQDL